MSEFTPITTQEAFDNAIKERINREKDTLQKQHDQLASKNTELESEVAQLQAAISETGEASKNHDQTVSELNAKLAGYETASLRTKIALQHGLPLDLADRLVGDDEESIKADAERMAPLFKITPPVPPLKDSEPPLGEGKDAAYKKLIENLNSEGE